MIIYVEWPIIHFDVGLEARRNPEDPEEYAVNKVVRYGDQILPMILLPRGVLPNIARQPINSGNSAIERMAILTARKNEDFEKFLKDTKGFGKYILNAFIKATYIKLAQEGKVIV